MTRGQARSETESSPDPVNPEVHHASARTPDRVRQLHRHARRGRAGRRPAGHAPPGRRPLQRGHPRAPRHQDAGARPARPPVRPRARARPRSASCDRSRKTRTPARSTSRSNGCRPTCTPPAAAERRPPSSPGAARLAANGGRARSMARRVPSPFPIDTPRPWTGLERLQIDRSGPIVPRFTTRVARTRVGVSTRTRVGNPCHRQTLRVNRICFERLTLPRTFVDLQNVARASRPCSSSPDTGGTPVRQRKCDVLRKTCLESSF